MLILNLGCGTKTSDFSEVVNLDWSIYLRIKSSRVLSALARFLMSRERYARFTNLPSNIRVHDLSKGIPFADQSVDMVYHSHLLEHLDRPVATKFLKEVWRVLKIGGIHRIVVPDLELACRNYLNHVEACDRDPGELNRHDAFVAGILEQCVRKESVGAREQTKVRRFFDNLLLGDARKRGETHQWMYDRHNLSAELLRLGYSAIEVHRFDTSSFPDWNKYRLDRGEGENAYKPESLYLEAKRTEG